MSNIKTGDILNFDYTGAVQSVTLPKGTYKLECWGAQGGYSSSNSGIEVGMGGKGGYSAGTITLNQKTPIYIYAGGVGSISGNGKADGGFPNGGSSWASSTSEGAGGGGGSSDIRIGTDSLYARVIVAGGGGGGGEDNETGGYGGGETGGTSGSGTPGSQTAPSGYFGIGGHTSYDGGGGGGGWYGAYPAGGQTTPATGSSGSDTSGSPGGSGYVYTSATASNYPSGCLLNSSYYLSDAKTIAGDTSSPSPSGTSETGHSGNGYCRITVIKCKSTALYTRINNSMKKATAFYFKLNNNKMYGVGSANSNPQNSTIMNFTYTGSVQTTTLVPGEYKFECWGASGGDAANATYNGGTGGKGGYSFGMLKISSTSKYYIIVGGQGQNYNTSLNKKYAGAGGFGGGGAGGAAWMSGDVSGGAGGGGLSGIFKSATYNGNEIISAGGGGGGGGSASSNSSDHYHGSNGGAGGGLTGKDGVYNICGTMSISHKNSSYVGRGGTQAAGGAATNQNSIAGGKLYGGGGGGYSAGASGNSTTLSGGTAQTSSNSSSSAGGSGGGGGGYYGGSGGGQYGQGAGGGSGYINPVLKNSNLIAGDQSFPSPTGGTETGHSGNGYVRITKLTDIIYLTHAKSDIMDFNYTGSVQSKTLKPGTYTIECWGGQGGTYSSYIGGYGGYSKGTITLTEATTVYVSVGGAGSSSSTAAGFNGGGTGISSGRGGGGATDVRISQNSLYSRVIVAGGGGGAGVTSANVNPCGCGGGEYGGDGYYNDTTGSYTTGQNRCGGSASQTAGGITWSTGTQATFGQGGNASGYSCGGGGGGWYGGGGAYDSDSDSDGRWGGGGSGYVYTSSTAKNYPNGCLLNSTYYLTNAQTIAGNTSFTSPTGSAETGHTGSGFCRITNLNPTQYGLYVKTNSGWKHIDL